MLMSGMSPAYTVAVKIRAAAAARSFLMLFLSVRFVLFLCLHEANRRAGTQPLVVEQREYRGTANHFLAYEQRETQDGCGVPDVCH